MNRFVITVAGGNDFLFNIITSDETWFHHLNPEKKLECGMVSHDILKNGQLYPWPAKLWELFYRMHIS
jgi:hypothetical protein